jgi:flavin-dependent dehydrogenase
MKYDVAIIGGGPGGSSAAIYLRKKGWNVVLFEKEVFPRDHVGESLIPYCYYKLKEMGVLEEIMEFSTKKPGVNFVDADGMRQSVWCFDRILQDGAEMSMHTLRAPFDHALLKKAASDGTDVFEGATVRSADLSDPESVSLRVLMADGSEQTAHARFLIDASGQHSFLAGTLGSRKAYEGLDRVALFTHWVNTTYDAALAGGLIKIIYLGGQKVGWLWVIPVGRNHLSIGVTLNNSYVREQKKLLGNNWKEELYRREVAEAVNLHSVLKGANMEHEVQVLGDFSFSVEKKFGRNYVHVGDSGAFLDPIFSSGIYVAMEVAERSSRCIDVQLREGEQRGQAMFRDEFVKINGAYRLIEKFVRLFYEPGLLNFSHTGGTEDGFNRFLNAYEIFHYLLAGDFFSEYKKYESFLDDLNSERQFNKFIHYVKSQAKEFPAGEFCRYSYDEVYGHLPMRDTVAPGLLKK